MGPETNVKQQVREFYDQVGWQLVDAEHYQNAHYEDLRPVAHEYIRRCHLRVGRRLAPQGYYLLDAGCGPIQYPEYLTYSQGYRYRVCADISIVALQEARQKIGPHGLFVVADVANLPFAGEVFDGVVSLHTIHHLPEEEHLQAYQGLYRVLAPGRQAVVVNGWPSSQLMRRFRTLMRLSQRVQNLADRLRGRPRKPRSARQGKAKDPKGTYTSRHDVAWMKNVVGAEMPLQIRVWRSVSVKFLRALIHPWLGGRLWLRLLFWLEERNPGYFGERGQYPLIVISKPGTETPGQLGASIQK